MADTSFWNEKIKFVTLETPRFMVAPLDGITDSPFRQLIRQFSIEELLFTEMRHVAQVYHEPKKHSLVHSAIEQPLAFQFSANTTDFIEEAVEKVINLGFVMINLNSGCPAKAVTGSGSGSALMSTPILLEKIIKCFKQAINGRVPFTLKIRSGFKEKNALQISQMAENNGVEGIIIHPRTQKEKFSSELDYNLTRQIKQSIKIPLVFSGGIDSFQQAEKVYDLTGADGFMIGQAIWGAPWKLLEIIQESQGKRFVATTQMIIACAIKHLDLNLKSYGPKGFIPFKKHLAKYIKKIPNASNWRRRLLDSQTADEMRQLLVLVAKEQDSLPTSTES